MDRALGVQSDEVSFRDNEGSALGRSAEGTNVPLAAVAGRQ